MFLWVQVKYRKVGQKFVFIRKQTVHRSRTEIVTPMLSLPRGFYRNIPFRNKLGCQNKVTEKSKSMSPLVIGVLLSFSCQKNQQRRKLRKRWKSIYSTPSRFFFKKVSNTTSKIYYCL
jgi:hypothetical protein